jgi:Tol biopolymer transport system component
LSLEPGTELQHYRLTEKIGEGGMGVVFKAVDTRLDREVAIKVLPDVFSQDPDRLARFEREAKLLASLNHPGIATVHGLYHQEDTHFLAMELVPGEDLAKRLQPGPLPVSEALLLCIQIAEALEAAHAQGVVHRDLKPANVLLTPEGKAKVLDFGLAKAFEPDPSTGHSPTMSPTLTSAGTAIGMILGTAAYMSPEQARGKAVDKRTDIWAFGCLLFELLTGRSVFGGETVTDSMGAILHKDPDWSALPAGTPPTVRLLLRRCLAKNPDRRLHDIADARIEIEQAIADPEASMMGLAGEAVAEAEARGTAGSRRLSLALGIGGVVLGLLAGFAVSRVLSPGAPAAEVRKFDLGIELEPAAAGAIETSISPDGSKVAMTMDGKLWVQKLDELEPREIDGTDGALSPFWSPDGEQVGYFTDDKILRVAAVGGPSSVICELEGSPAGGRGATWSEDGRVLYSRGNTGVLEVSARGGEPRELIAPDENESDLHEPHILPGGRGVLFVGHPESSSPTMLVMHDGEERKLLFHSERDRRIWSPVYDESGHILFRRGGDDITDGLWALPFSLASLEVEGEPFLVVAEAGSGGVSRDGTLVFVHRPQDMGSEVLVWVDRSGNPIETIGGVRDGVVNPASLSPDGSNLGFAAFDSEGNKYDAWVRDLERGTETRLTSDPAFEWGLHWLPSGEELVYGRFDPLTQAVETFVIAADGSGEPRKLVDGGVGSLSPDGKHLVYARAPVDAAGAVGDEDPLDLWIGSTDGSEDPRPLIQGPDRVTGGMVSPDGAYLAFNSNRSGRQEVYLTRFPSIRGTWQVSVSGGDSPVWSPTGDRLFFRSELALMEVAFEPTDPPRLGRPVKLFDRPDMPFGNRSYTVSADGTRFVIPDKVRRHEDAGDAPRSSIKIVQNWVREFEE